MLYLPRECGGLSLTLVISLHKKLQISHQAQLLMLADPTVRRIAEKHLQGELARRCKKFKAAVVAQDILQLDPSMSGKALRIAAKRQVAKKDDQARLSELQSLPKQGDLSHLATPTAAATIWVDVVQGLPDEPFKFALNAAHDTLPHNANLHLWGKEEQDTSPFCLEDSQNLVLVLNSCRVAREVR